MWIKLFSLFSYFFTIFIEKIYDIRVNHHRIGDPHDAYVMTFALNILKT